MGQAAGSSVAPAPLRNSLCTDHAQRWLQGGRAVQLASIKAANCAEGDNNARGVECADCADEAW